jgi:hypothetical protein
MRQKAYRILICKHNRAGTAAAAVRCHCSENLEYWKKPCDTRGGGREDKKTISKISNTVNQQIQKSQTIIFTTNKILQNT